MARKLRALQPGVLSLTVANVPLVTCTGSSWLTVQVLYVCTGVGVGGLSSFVASHKDQFEAQSLIPLISQGHG